MVSLNNSIRAFCCFRNRGGVRDGDGRGFRFGKKTVHGIYLVMNARIKLFEWLIFIQLQ